MNRIKTKSTGIVLRITAVLTAILFCAAVPAQTALTGHATNSLGSQGSVNNGDSEGGNEGAEDAGGDDAELNEIINENSEEGINGTTVAKIKIIAASARVRSEASTNSSVVGSLSSGDVMDVTGETTGSEGKIWYQITGEKDGKAIIIITHKLHEVLAVSDRVAVLRKGEYIGDTDTATASQQSLTDMMVGRAVSLNIDRPLNENQTERLKVEHLTVKNKEGVKMLDDVTFTAMGGEILGIAGIAGSGQKELLESISGLQKLEAGSKITYIEPDGTECLLNGMDPLDIIRKGLLLSFVPEDRFGMGLVGGMNIIQNIMLRTYRRGKGPLTDRKFPRDLSQKIVDDLEVVTPDINRTPIRRLSGGNVQKVLVGREIAQNPAVLMTAYAVRGLDINTSYVIYNLLTEQKMKGVSVIYVGEDLDVLLELCDRILVLCGGKVSGIVDGRKTTKDAVGLMMTKIGG